LLCKLAHRDPGELAVQARVARGDSAYVDCDRSRLLLATS
jgi:hypothetical protein